MKAHLTVAIAAVLLGLAPAHAAPGVWGGLKAGAPPPRDVLAAIAGGQSWDVQYLESPLTPGILFRMKSRRVRLFAELDRYGAEPPAIFWVMTKAGAKSFTRGDTLPGDAMAASWILLSFQGCRGWELFDVPWMLSLEKRPSRVALTEKGLQIEFARADSGHIFSMPFYGYDKPPQQKNDFAALHGLPSPGVKPWQWRDGLPPRVLERCAWWNRVSKAFPAGFDETFRVAPGSDEITFRQDYKWFTIADDWGTAPLRFAVLPPSVGLAWLFPGFPMSLSAPVHNPEYFTAFGPLVGALDVDRLEVSMQVLQYVNEFEWLLVPSVLDGAGRDSLARIVEGARAKFTGANRLLPDHGGFENFAWSLAGDVWYPRALPFLSGPLKEDVRAALRIYFERHVLRPHSPYHGKYILHGPGIGSWGEWGDAGKFMATALQAIWAYAQFTDDWPLIRERWDLIRRFFVTPEEADWVSFGRYSIAEIGDEAAPCAAYARMAWMAGDLDQYLLGSYMFARELVHLYVKQRAGPYFYRHQPYNLYEPMPPHIYPTNVWGSTRGWQVDGPVWGSGEHQSANRWMRFHDPEVGRFYRERLARDIGEELDWYTLAGKTGQPPNVFAAERYRAWLTQDSPHMMPSLIRLRSLLLDQPGEMPARSGWGAAGIAAGYARLRTAVPRTYWRVVPRETPPSPFVPGLQRTAEGSSPTLVQDVRRHGLKLEPRWNGWEMPVRPDAAPDGAFRSFGMIEGDFEGRVAGKEATAWVSYGCRMTTVRSIVPRALSAPAGLVAGQQDRTPVAVIGPFGNANDNELSSVAYPPEEAIDLSASYPGLSGSIAWRRTLLAPGRRVDLSRELAAPPGTAGLAYILQYIWAPAPVEGYLLIGHHGGVAAWVNGANVLSYHGPHRPSGDDALIAPAELAPGWNRVLLKVESFTGHYTFQFRFVHLDRQPVAGLRFSDELHAPTQLTAGKRPRGVLPARAMKVFNSINQ